MDNDLVECCDEGVGSCLDEGVVACFDKNNEDDFDVDFLLEYPSEYILKGTLCGKFIVHHGYMKKIVWYKTHIHFCHEHNYNNSMIYQAELNYGRERG